MTGSGTRAITVSPVIAWSLVALVLIGGWTGLVEPLLAYKADLGAQIAADRATIRRQKLLLARAADLDQRLARADTVLAAARPSLLDAAGPAGAAALQTRLRDAGTASGLRIDSIRVLAAAASPATAATTLPTPVPTPGTLVEVRLAATATGTGDAWQALLHDLESGLPWLRVDKLAISVTSGDAGALGGDLEVTALAVGPGG